MYNFSARYATEAASDALYISAGKTALSLRVSFISSLCLSIQSPVKIIFLSKQESFDTVEDMFADMGINIDNV